MHGGSGCGIALAVKSIEDLAWKLSGVVAVAVVAALWKRLRNCKPAVVLTVGAAVGAAVATWATHEVMCIVRPTWDDAIRLAVEIAKGAK